MDTPAQLLYVTDVRIEPPEPRAGETFRIIATLNEQVSTNPMKLGWEKERIKFTARSGDAPEIRPTGANYFLVNPNIIRIPVGEDTGYTEAAVRHDALDSDDGSRVPFPDNLVLFYFVALPGGTKASQQANADQYCTRIVKIRPA